MGDVRHSFSVTVICKEPSKMPEAIIQHHLHLMGIQIICVLKEEQPELVTQAFLSCVKEQETNQT